MLGLTGMQVEMKQSVAKTLISFHEFSITKKPKIRINHRNLQLFCGFDDQVQDLLQETRYNMLEMNHVLRSLAADIHPAQSI